jgi:hypothetical protein
VQPGSKAKVPYFLHGDDVLAFAGLYELRPDPELPEDHPDRWLWTYTILTTTASDALGHVHDRTPVLLSPELRDDWLDPANTDLVDVRSLLEAVPEPRLQLYAVSTAVNSPKNNGPELLERVWPECSSRALRFQHSSTQAGWARRRPGRRRVSAFLWRYGGSDRRSVMSEDRELSRMPGW